MEKEISMKVSQKILGSAYKCISEKGYAQASLRDIAEDAGVALSQLNYYYRNKEGLFTEVVRELSRNYISEVEAKLQKGSSAKERFNCLIAYFKSTMHDRPDIMKLLFDLVSMSFWNPSFKILLSTLFNDVSGLIKKYIFEDTAAKIKYEKFSAEALAKSMVGTFFGTAMQYVLNPADKTLIDSLNCIEISVG